jgi:PhzF family phenazine biosynthesis protein
VRTELLYQVDAFASEVFRGNPAAVCPLPAWLDDDLMQRIAAENNLSETAFLVGSDGLYRLRWFTPRAEVKLCGHATLASAFVIFTQLGYGGEIVRFDTLSGRLEVRRDGDLRVMNFPSYPPEEVEDPPAALLLGLGTPPSAVLFGADDYFAVYEDEAAVRALRPNLDRFEELESRGVAVTAPGEHADFVSRYFVPRLGIPEDPVTGSIHSVLTPYWASRLGKERLSARQLSQRGGELWCGMLGDRVSIAGHAVLYMEGRLFVGGERRGGATT